MPKVAGEYKRGYYPAKDGAVAKHPSVILVAIPHGIIPHEFLNAVAEGDARVSADNTHLEFRIYRPD